MDLENARQVYDRCHRELGNAPGLFRRNIISKKELDDAISADEQALQKFRQAEITLEKTPAQLSWPTPPSVATLEAKKYYDNEGRRMLDIVLEERLEPDVGGVRTRLGGDRIRRGD